MRWTVHGGLGTLFLSSWDLRFPSTIILASKGWAEGDGREGKRRKKGGKRVVFLLVATVHMWLLDTEI